MSFTVPQAAIDKLLLQVKDQILFPKLSEISTGIREFIAYEGHFIKSKRVSNPVSISDIQATKQYTSKKKLTSKISSVAPQIYINKVGYVSDVYKFADDDPYLRLWIRQNYFDANRMAVLNNSEPLRVRGKNNWGTTPRPPLGHPSRDVFKNGFDTFIINKGMYGLS